MSLEQSLCWKIRNLTEQLSIDIDLVATEEDIESLSTALEAFIAILQNKTGISDTFIKEAISDYIRAKRIKPEDLFTWNAAGACYD